jgi:hypothetical protein
MLPRNVWWGFLERENNLGTETAFWLLTGLPFMEGGLTRSGYSRELIAFFFLRR